jgi:outer membrane receptor protein involved in Fe transport
MGVLVSSMSFAQGSSVITGNVTDAATHKPVPDVVITASSPALQGEEVVVTDSAGSYRLAQLPAGVYTLKLEKESYKPFARSEINVRTDRTVRLNIEVQPESIQSDVMDVKLGAPTVDVGSTTTGLNVGKDFINNIAFIQPNGSGVKSFESLAAVAPQVIQDEFGYGFSGAQSAENNYLVDGVSTNDPAFGVNGSQFPVEFVEEANVITGGYQAEYGRTTGGVLNVVTKSGSNEFHGTVWGDITPGVLAGVSPAIKNDSSVFVGQTRLWNSIDFGAEVGGPIVKDKLWFFVGFSPSFVRSQSTQSLRRFLINADGTDFQYDTDGYIKSEPLAGTTKTRFNDIRAFSYIAKLTYLVNSDNNISLSVVGSPTTATQPYSFNDRRIAWNGGFTANNNTSTVSLRYQGGFLDKHLLADVSLGWFHSTADASPNDGSSPGSTVAGSAYGTPLVRLRRYNADSSVGPVTSPYSINDLQTLPADAAAKCEPAGTKSTNVVSVRGEDRILFACPATGPSGSYGFGGFGGFSNTALDRLQGRASLTYLVQALGHHIFKVGIDVENLRYDISKGYSGGAALQENITGTRFDDFRTYGYFTGPDTIERTLVVHGQPTSVGIGAYVQDSWSIADLVTLNAGLRYDNQQLFTASGLLGMSLNNQFAPRVGLIYDFTQQGRSKLFGNFSQYYEGVPIDLADRALTGESTFNFRRARSANATRQGCDPLKDIGQATNECNDPNNYQQINRLLGDNYSVNASGQAVGNGVTPVDPNIKPQSSDEIVVGGEYEIISDGRLGASYTKRWMNYVIEDMSLDEGNRYFLSNPGYGQGSAFPKATRDYDAVSVYFTKSFSDGWMAQFSYTYSSLRGNYNGLFRPETGQLDPNINSDFDLVSLLANRNGPLDADRNHFVKVFAAKEFRITNAVGLTIGLTYQGRSGAPINYLASHPSYGADESFVLPRGAAGRLPFRHEFDAKVGVSYRLNKDNQIQVTADVFNLFNFQAVTSVDQTLSNADFLPFQAPAGKDPATAACLSGSAQPQCPSDGTLPIKEFDPNTGAIVNANSSQLNPNFKRPTGYQAPISVRFGVRFTF